MMMFEIRYVYLKMFISGILNLFYVHKFLFVTVFMAGQIPELLNT